MNQWLLSQVSLGRGGLGGIEEKLSIESPLDLSLSVAIKRIGSKSIKKKKIKHLIRMKRIFKLRFGNHLLVPYLWIHMFGYIDTLQSIPPPPNEADLTLLHPAYFICGHPGGGGSCSLVFCWNHLQTIHKCRSHAKGDSHKFKIEAFEILVVIVGKNP